MRSTMMTSGPQLGEHCEVAVLRLFGDEMFIIVTIGFGAQHIVQVSDPMTEPALRIALASRGTHLDDIDRSISDARMRRKRLESHTNHVANNRMQRVRVSMGATAR